MQAEEVTRVLRTLVQDNGKTLERLHGSRAVAIARDMADVVRFRLRDEGPFDTVWNDFTADPEGIEPEVTGALETLIEAYPSLKKRLEELLADYDQIVSGTDIAQSNVITTTNTKLTVEEETDKYSRGTYLYGNVPGGEESEGRRVDVEESDFGGHGRLEHDLAHAIDIPGIFQRLYRAVQDDPDLNGALKTDLETDLRKIQNLLSRQDALTKDQQDQLVTLLENVRTLSQDIFEILILALQKDKTELSDPARNAIEQL